MVKKGKSGGTVTGGGRPSNFGTGDGSKQGTVVTKKV